MTERIVIIDYGAGNLRSAAHAIQAVVTTAGRTMQVIVAETADTVVRADRIILPGVGAFGQCAAALRSVPDMEDALAQRVLKDGAPFLAVGVGMQLLARRASDYGTQTGLGWIPGEVVKLVPRNPMLKVPHMGWNKVSLKLAGFQNPALRSVEDGGQAYFVHSHQFQPSDHRHLLGTCDYGGPVTAIVGRDNILGVQFQPEKSQSYGLTFLRAFLGWRP